MFLFLCIRDIVQIFLIRGAGLSGVWFLVVLTVCWTTLRILVFMHKHTWFPAKKIKVLEPSHC